SLSLQGRLRPPPRASTAEGWRARLRVRRRRRRRRADDRRSADERPRTRRGSSWLRTPRPGEDRQPAAPQSPDRRTETLLRRAPPRSCLWQLGNFTVSRNPRLLEPRRSAADRTAPARGDAWPGLARSTARRVRFDGPAFYAPGIVERDPLLRAVPRARQGLVL